MSERFSEVLAVFRRYSSIRCFGLCGDEGVCDECMTRMADRFEKAHDREIRMTSKAEYSRGYEDGRRSKDADHAAVALRLSRLRFDGGSHENLHKVAYAVYPCATGWTCESSDGLRDRLVDLMGGVHEHCCDSGRGCACDDSRACGVGEHAEAVTAYDVLGNERHEAVCKLRKMTIDSNYYGNYQRIALAIGTVYDGRRFASECVRDRLIYLLGGDEPNFTDIAETIKSGDECEDKLMENGENHKIATIADELRECVEKATKTYDDTLWHEMGDDSDADHTICHITEGELLGIADRIEEQFARVCELWERTATVTAQGVHDDMEAECNKLQTKLDAIREALDGRR